MCWESEIDIRPVRERDEELSLLKFELKRLKEAKKEIEGKISVQWRKIAKVCGHPKARISGWSTSECLDCGYYASTKYFMGCGSALIDVDGHVIERRYYYADGM